MDKINYLKIEQCIQKIQFSPFLEIHPLKIQISSILNEINQDVIILLEELGKKEKYLENIRTQLTSKTHFGFFHSKNLRMQTLFTMAEKYKDSPIPLLILGEKGCGKEALARAIHLKSYRRGPFLIYDSSKILADFLKEKDATLYFSEVSLVTPEKQKILLDCLNINSPGIRIIVSAVQIGELEEPIYQKLKCSILNLVPLRDRREDILSLVDIFVREFSKNEKDISCLSSSALSKIIEYPWPGNLSELKLEIKKILIEFPDQKHYTLTHLSEKIIGSSLRELHTIIKNTESLSLALEILERKMVLEALLNCHWNKSRSAKLLGISRSNLIQKIQKYHYASTSTFSATKRRITSRNSSFISMN